MAFVTRLSLRLGVVVFLGVLLLFGTGIFAATQVQQDLLPDISVPAVIVITPYPGASPEVVDQQVSVPVGNAMQGVAGANTVQATATQGASLVISPVQGRHGPQVRRAGRQQRAWKGQSVCSRRKRCRRRCKPSRPTACRSSPTRSPPTRPSATSSGQLRAAALPKLKGLAGVASVVISGAPTDEVDVTLDPAKLAAHGISLGQVASALQQASIVQSIGSLKQGSATIPIQISGALTSLDQIGKITVTPAGASPGGKPAAPVPIDQLGTVSVVSVPADTITRTNGKPSIGLQVIKGPNANTVTVANEVWIGAARNRVVRSATASISNPSRTRRRRSPRPSATSFAKAWRAPSLRFSSSSCSCAARARPSWPRSPFRCRCSSRSSPSGSRESRSTSSRWAA